MDHAKYRVLLGLMIGVFILGGCQSIRYEAQEAPRITMKDLHSGGETFTYETDLKFYFWGFDPSPHVFDLTELAMQVGAKNGISSLRIREEQTLVNGLLMFITLGIYAPRNVQITGVKIP